MSILGFNAAYGKQPWEQHTLSLSFNDVSARIVVSGYLMNNCTLTIFDSTGADTGNNMVAAGPTVDANNSAVLVTIKGGNDGQDYYARFRTIWTKAAEPDQNIEKDLLIEVREV